MSAAFGWSKVVRLGLVQASLGAVVVMTTSKAEEDVFRSYDFGASSFITKPVTFDRLVELMKALGEYWVEVVELPD